MLTAWLNFGAWTCAHAPMRVRCLVDAAVGKGQERDMPRLFNCRRNDALMFGAGAGLAAGAQTAFFGHVFAEKVDLFVVDGQGFVGAELAELGLGKELAVAAAVTAFTAFGAFGAFGALRTFGTFGTFSAAFAAACGSFVTHFLLQRMCRKGL